MIFIYHTFVVLPILIPSFAYAFQGEEITLFPQKTQSFVDSHSNNENLSVLQQTDLSGTDTNFDHSVQFETFAGDPKYVGVIAFNSTNLDFSEVSQFEFETNIKAPTKNTK